MVGNGTLEGLLDGMFDGWFNSTNEGADVEKPCGNCDGCVVMIWPFYPQ